MKTHPIICLSLAAFGLASFPGVGYAADNPGVLPPSNAMVSISITDAGTGPATADQATATSDRWNDLKNLTYAMRTEFLSGLDQLQAKLDSQLNELTAQRAAVKNPPDAEKLDFALKQMYFSRTYLRSLCDTLGNTTPATWEQQKAKFGQAWMRTQDEYAKVKSSLAT